MDKEDGGPAFPRHFDYMKHGAGGIISSQDGMSIRDAFAIGAVSGHLASMNAGSLDRDFCAHVARSAYMVADAMIAARGAR